MLTIHTPHPHAGTCSHWWLWRRFANTDRQPPPEPAAVTGTAPWRTCPMCWGQGRIYNATLTAYQLCPHCLGFREIPSI